MLHRLRQITYMSERLKREVDNSRTQFRRLVIDEHGTIEPLTNDILYVMHKLGGLSDADIDLLNWLEWTASEHQRIYLPSRFSPKTEEREERVVSA